MAQFGSLVVTKPGRKSRDNRKVTDSNQNGHLMEGIEITNGMIDSVKDYAILTMDKDRHILSWNTGAHEMFGYTREEITGRPIDVLFTDDDVKNGQPEKEVEAALNERRGPNDIWLKERTVQRFTPMDCSLS
jgi:two-component system CheB/CheR fusion protein